MFSLALLALLPLLGSVQAKHWGFQRSINFIWANPDKIQYVFETPEHSNVINWPIDSPTYHGSLLAAGDGSTAPAADAVAVIQVAGDKTPQGDGMSANVVKFWDTYWDAQDGVHPPRDIWWTPDWQNKGIVRKRCTLTMTGDPQDDVIWDIAKAEARPKSNAAVQDAVTASVQFTCVEDPVPDGQDGAPLSGWDQ